MPGHLELVAVVTSPGNITVWSPGDIAKRSISTFLLIWNYSPSGDLTAMPPGDVAIWSLGNITAMSPKGRLEMLPGNNFYMPGHPLNRAGRHGCQTLRRRLLLVKYQNSSLQGHRKITRVTIFKVS